MAAPNEQSPLDRQGPWPSLPLAAWQDTHDTLHMWMQVVDGDRHRRLPTLLAEEHRAQSVAATPCGGRTCLD
jgi:hypothetical protein